MGPRIGKLRLLVLGGGAMLAGALVAIGAQPETVVLPDPPAASAPVAKVTSAPGAEPVVATEPAVAATAPLPASAPTPAASVPARPARAAVPGREALAAAVKLVEDVYREDVSFARTPGQRENLARKIRADAAGEKDIAGRYAMLLKARDLALNAGDVATVQQAIVDLEAAYEVDGLKLAADALVPMIRGVHLPGQRRALFDFTQKFAERALDAESYDIARAMAERNGAAARMVGDVKLIRDAQGLMLGVQDADAAFAAAKKGAETLASQPADPEANLKVGVYRCFYRGQWQEGLANLAAGSDEKLAALAKKELAAQGTPGESLELADEWWDVGLKGTVVTKRQIWKHATRHYNAALPALSGLVKAKVSKRLEEAALTQGLEVPAFVMTFLNSVEKQLPARDNPADEFRRKCAALSGPANSALRSNRRDAAISFQARLKSVHFDSAGQMFERYETHFDYKGLPVRLMALQSRAAPLREADAEYVKLQQQLKSNPDAVYLIEGTAPGFYVQAAGATDMGASPQGEATHLLLRVRWSNRTFTATMQP